MYIPPQEFEQGHTMAYKLFKIKHMIQMVEITLFNTQKQVIKITPPETDEELKKLESMYQTVLDNIGK